MKITIILPCFLGEYHGAAKDRKTKLKRAIDSFLNQDYKNSELIIVSDGCNETSDFIRQNYSDSNNVFCFKIDKQPLFSGAVRQKGLDLANGDAIAYLDGDDILGDGHLSAIAAGMEGKDWVYFDDYVRYSHLPQIPPEKRVSVLRQGNIGTSNIAHRKLEGVTWGNCHNYGHDFVFIQRMASKYSNYAKIEGGKYIVCHIPNSIDN